MADYTRRFGSKEKIGIVLSTTDSTKFTIESATVTITGHYLRPNRGMGAVKEDNVCVTKAACAVDSPTALARHQIEYLFSCDAATVSPGANTAEFAATLSDGQVIVRTVTVNVVEA